MISDLTKDGRAMLELENHAGFHLLCAHYDAQLADLQLAINSETNGGKETQRNKRAMTKLQNAHPRFLLGEMLKAAQKQFQKEVSESQSNRRN